MSEAQRPRLYTKVHTNFGMTREGFVAADRVLEIFADALEMLVLETRTESSCWEEGFGQ